MNLGRGTRLARMAHIAVFHTPRNFTIMASAAKLAINNFGHGYLVAASLEFETKVGVADFAREAYSVKPVWENGGAHTRLVGVVVDDHIAIFGLSFWNTHKK